MAYRRGQTAVIVPVPAAEPVVGPWRSRFDRSAPFGVPAHITVVFPWLAGDRVDGPALRDLGEIVRTVRPFPVAFGAIRQFPAPAGSPPVAYLEPDPAAPFRELTAALVRRWPEAPPYEGRFDESIPHLTVTDSAPADTVAELGAALAGSLPVRAWIDRAALIQFDGAAWRERASLPLLGDA